MELRNPGLRILPSVARQSIKILTAQWILPEWSQAYTDLPLPKRRKRKKAAGLPYRTKQIVMIVDFLANKEGKKALATQIIKDLSLLDKRFTKISLYRLFAESRYFEKEGDVWIAVKLRE